MPDLPHWLTDLGNTANAVFAVDEQQRILTWNGAAERLFGRRSAQVLGRPCHQVVGGRLRSGDLLCRLPCPARSRAARGDVVPDFELLATSAGRQRRWLTVSLTAVDVDDCRFALHVVRSAAHRQRTEEALRQIVRTLNDLGIVRPSDHHQEAGPPGPVTARVPTFLSLLSDREIEVLGLLARDCSTEQVAKRLRLSPLTVRCHIRNMLRKTRLHSRHGLVAAALRNGMSVTETGMSADAGEDVPEAEPPRRSGPPGPAGSTASSPHRS